MKHKNPGRSLIYSAKNKLAFAFILFFLFFSCKNDNVLQPSFETHNFFDLSNNDIFLIKVNTSSRVVRAANTGSVLGSFPDYQNIRPVVRAELDDNTRPPIGHPAAREFSANPPPIIEEISPRLQSLSAFVPPGVGDQRMFLVETFLGSGRFEEQRATLKAYGTHGNIWVMDNVRTPLPEGRAKELARRFDLIYPRATAILGYEYGGGPGGNGGRDRDPRIQILVYDILDRNGTVAAGGFFWGKDWFPRSQIPSSNEAEIFYIDTSQVIRFPDFAAAILVHELQHMINWNMKFVRHGRNSAAWYNEMLSAMAEDIILPMVGVGAYNRYHPINQRLRLFLATYHERGVTEWHNQLACYSRVFGFGAYLLRNFGGADLLRRILHNNTVNEASITAALPPGITFEIALIRFGEALVFSGDYFPPHRASFDRTDGNTIIYRNNERWTYTAYGFNIMGFFNSQYSRGAYIHNLTPRDMRPHSIVVQSSDAWRNITGDFSITLEKPHNGNIMMYLLVR
ncbi:MAG: hypothetical protein FWC36_07100 [Spirochaetes bacterium]|nr:hypothetical protein [Spirochaetota bacterium]